MRTILATQLLFAAIWASPVSQALTRAWMDPPPVMRIECEEIKTGLYAPHAEFEATVAQMTAKWKLPWYSIALESETRPDQACYLIPFQSFADWQADERFLEENAGFNKEDAEFRRKDNEFVSRYHDVAIRYEEELSYRPVFDMVRMRYLVQFKIHVRPGRQKEFEEARKIYLAAHVKGNVDEHMIAYWALMGEPLDTYFVFLPMQLLAELDQSEAKHKGFAEAIRDNEKHMDELESVAVESSEIMVFDVNPRMSYVPVEWKKTDPAFWGPAASPGSGADAPPGKLHADKQRKRKN